MDSATTNLHPDFGPSGDPSQPLRDSLHGGVALPPAGQRHRSSTATRATRGPTRSAPTRRSKAARSRPATGTPSWSTRAPAPSTSSTTPSTAPSGSTAGSGAIWNLNSNALRPSGWTSADAAGLPILPGLLRYDEVQSGSITHAIRMTAEPTDTSFIWPARHEAGAAGQSQPSPHGRPLPAEGELRHLGLLAPGPGRPPGHAAVRPDPGRQRLELVLRGHGRSGVAERPRRRAQAGAGQRVRGGRRVLADGRSQLRTGPAERRHGHVLDRARLPHGGRPTVASSRSASRSTGPRAAPRSTAKIVGMAATPDGGGYWLVAADGGVFTFGDAGFYGSTGNLHLNQPIVGMAATPDGNGYWLVAADGGIFSFGDGRVLRLHRRPPPQPAHRGHGGRARRRRATGWSPPTGGSSPSAIGRASTAPPAPSTSTSPSWAWRPRPTAGATGWSAKDGGIFTFGDAAFYGSAGGLALDAPIVGMAATPDGGGYWLVASDGGVFTYGDAGFEGSAGPMASSPRSSACVGLRPGRLRSAGTSKRPPVHVGLAPFEAQAHIEAVGGLTVADARSGRPCARPALLGALERRPDQRAGHAAAPRGCRRRRHPRSRRGRRSAA